MKKPIKISAIAILTFFFVPLFVLISVTIFSFFPPTLLIDATFPREVLIEKELLPEASRLPHWKNGRQFETNCGKHSPRKASLAMLIFYVVWLEEFGDDRDEVGTALHNLHIKWGDRPVPLDGGYYLDGRPATNSHALGLTTGPTQVWVYIGKTSLIADTSLVHELIHVSINAIHKKGFDPDHEGSKYAGWSKQHTAAIHLTNKILRMLGI